VFSELKKSFNMTQFESIREMVLRERGIVLLQGPPGTGKTSTLLGLLAAQYAYLKKIYDKRKIMICAPSNAAINHITKRLRTEGLADGNGNKVYPKVLRLGIVDTEDKDITGCSLDHICESKIAA
jgi:senataxin